MMGGVREECDGASASFARPVWQPIATAPKDGTKVRLAWSPDNWTTAEGIYRDDEWFAAPLFYHGGKSKPGQIYLEFREMRVQPVFWMPLPPSPDESLTNLADAPKTQSEGSP